MSNKKSAKEENIDLVANLLTDLLLKPEPPTELDFKRVEEIVKKYSTREWLRVIWKVCLKVPKKGKLIKKG